MDFADSSELIPFPKNNANRPSEGLKIKPVAGDAFEINGTVTFKDFPDHGRVYYCGGAS